MKGISCGIKFHIDVTCLEKGEPAHNTGISIYCDGSHSNNQTGCGFVISETKTLEMRAINLDSSNSVQKSAL